MNDFDLKYKQYGERAILIEWPERIDESILKDVLRFKDIILNNSINEKIQINSAYNSLLVTYSHFIYNFNNKTKGLKSLYDSRKSTKTSKHTLWNIPVCYHANFGIDLEDMSKLNSISISELIERHCNPVYTVYFIGFLPGFLYLGGLDERLNIPRRSNPRQKIEKGAVAIGGIQTGIYPCESPGGWNIIGNSPLNFFNIDQADPCFAKAGDRVQFISISIPEYTKIKELVALGVYQIESEVIDD